MGLMTSTNSDLIRFATVQDCGVIRDIATQAWMVAYADILTPAFMAHELEREYSDQSIERQMTEHQHNFLLLENPAHQAIGFASYSFWKECVLVHKLYLHPGLKGKGYGAALMQRVSQEALARAAKMLELKVNRFNSAGEFYKKQGFTIVRQEDTLVGTEDGKEFWRNDYVMQRELL